MLSKSIEAALNKQIRIEAESSQVYLAMAVWAEVKGLEGISNFMYDQSDEEREHMLKLVKFVNERGGHAHISELNAPNVEFNSFRARTILDKINMIGDDKGGLYLFDRDIQQLTVNSAAQDLNTGA